MGKENLPDVKTHAQIDWNVIPHDQVNQYVEVLHKLDKVACNHLILATLMKTLALYTVVSSVTLLLGWLIQCPVLVTAFINVVTLAAGSSLVQVFIIKKQNDMDKLIVQHNNFLKKFVNRFFIE